MTNKLYTYGYLGNRDALKDLKRYAEAGCLIADIRMAPYSQRPDFRQGHLRQALGENYHHLPALGNLNYQRAGKEPIQINDLSSGLHALDALLLRQPVVILCGCKSHENCHRNMVAAELRVWQRLMGFAVAPVHHLAHGEDLPKVVEEPAAPEPVPDLYQNQMLLFAKSYYCSGFPILSAVGKKAHEEADIASLMTELDVEIPDEFHEISEVPDGLYLWSGTIDARGCAEENSCPVFEGTIRAATPADLLLFDTPEGTLEFRAKMRPGE